MYYTRDASPGGDAYCGFQQRRPGVESYTRSDRLLIAAPPREGDANNHDLSCFSCAVIFLVFLVACMVLLATQGSLQGSLQGRLRGDVQDMDAAAISSPSGGNPMHEDALKSEARPRERPNQQPLTASTHTRRLHKIDTTNLHRETTSASVPHSSAPERSIPPAPRTDLSTSSGDPVRTMT
ncbi:uncharacterized protein LOC142771679 [Rhipicephalus microplus]|uniref:uncharacterized protein LOC142771679 n=1 Tax=Rhipicephalus microplus TaxID=6941 RepID=UPI003F6AE58D